MQLSYRAQRRINEIFWTVCYFVLTVNLYSMVRFWEAEGYPQSELIADVITATLGGIVGGILLGLFHLYFFKNTVRRRSFGSLILTKSLADLVIIFVVFISVTTLSGVLFFERTWAESFDYNLNYMTTLPFWGLVIYLLVVSALFNFLRQVSKKFGRGVMLGLLLGRYHQPREDERIVMFLDLKSSTTHAEKLGHIRYSRLIQDCFYDLNSLLMPYEAQVYKYVGDEAILSWAPASGLRQGNCLHIFFAYHHLLEERRDWYEKEYGLVPEFKAGLNIGRITVAEVGEDRREIEYHGDVLNTAARIQGQCNDYGKRLLISENLLAELGPLSGLTMEEIGDLELKGKQQRVKIFSVEPTEAA